MSMSKRADKEWGEMWSREKEIECCVALHTLASSVYTHWRNRINQEYKTTSGEWIDGISLGHIHDIWNSMYYDMKALYTLEQLVNYHYKTLGFESKKSDRRCNEKGNRRKGRREDKCCFCMKTMTPIDADKCEFYADKRHDVQQSLKPLKVKPQESEV